jgi:hypothetical protein
VKFIETTNEPFCGSYRYYDPWSSGYSLQTASCSSYSSDRDVVHRVHDQDDSVGSWRVGIGPYYNKMAVEYPTEIESYSNKIIFCN